MAASTTSSKLTECNHPVVLHKLAHLREKNQPPREFRRLMHDLTLLIGYEASRSLNTKDIDVCSPLAETMGKHLSQNIAIIPILRAGLGMSDAMLELLPNAATYHIGMYRLKTSKMPVQYYNRLPKDNIADVAFVLDPIIASGITVSATVGQLKMWGCKKIVVVSLIATAQGAAALRQEHPDIELFVGQASDDLTADGSAVPGLGDAGNRQFDSGEMAENPYGITMAGGSTPESLSLLQERKRSVDLTADLAQTSPRSSSPGKRKKK